jgi:hypothetical protein
MKTEFLKHPKNYYFVNWGSTEALTKANEGNSSG